MKQNKIKQNEIKQNEMKYGVKRPSFNQVEN